MSPRQSFRLVSPLAWVGFSRFPEAYRVAFVILTACLALAGCSGGNSAASAASPSPAVFATDRLVFDSDRTGNHEIFVMKVDGSEAIQLTHDARYENWWPRMSPDRKMLLFYRAPAGHHEDYGQASLWRMNADGTAMTQLRAQGDDGWTFQGHAEWSPDGSKIAMAGSAGAALEIFVTDASGKNPVQYTNRGGINTDVSWSPDGTKLLFNGCPATPCVAANFEIYVMAASPLSPATRLTNDGLADYDPYYSPDGSRIARLVTVDPTTFPFGSTTLGSWSIAISNADGSNAAYVINDGNINSKPAWSVDGQTIYFHRMVPPDYRFRIFRINKDGTGLTELTVGAPGNNEYPSNQ